MLLSICVVTMNRADQVIKALESCIKCLLPPINEWEMIVVDNASTDRTRDCIYDFFNINENIQYTYKKLEKNLGVGGGRNIAYNLSAGKYVYMLDDDAVVDYGGCPDFFMDAIDLFNKNSNFASISTQIFDDAMKKNRIDDYRFPIKDDCYKCFMFCGGSHFLNKAVFGNSPYLNNMYGMEEMLPSLRAFDKGFENVFYAGAQVIHQPKINKWEKESTSYNEIASRYIVLSYVIKRELYPKWASPVCYLAYLTRTKRHIAIDKNKKQAILSELDECSEQLQQGISTKTVIKLFMYFGISIF